MPKYCFSGSPLIPAQELTVRFLNPDGRSWTGAFECARDRHVDIMPWLEAESVVVVASNALYIVDSEHPDTFSGFSSPIAINNAVFDEDRSRLFVAESLRIRAYGRNRKLLWISESLEGYDAVIRSCSEGILAVDVEQEIDQPRRSVYVRAEDGAIIRSPQLIQTEVAHTMRRRSA